MRNPASYLFDFALGNFSSSYASNVKCQIHLHALEAWRVKTKTCDWLGSDTEAVDGKAVRWEGNLEGGGVLKAANHMKRII